MRKIFLAAAVALLPLLASASGPSSVAAPDGDVGRGSGIGPVLLISAGVVGGLVVADLLVGGSMTTPFVKAVTPAMAEARAAGAVFGEQIAAATGLRDAEARADLLYALVVGSGALLGGWFASRYVSQGDHDRSAQVSFHPPASGQSASGPSTSASP